MEPASQSDDAQENAQFSIYDSPIHSDVEAKLRKLLHKLAVDNKILGIQVCAYKDGEVVVDTAAGVLGKNDPRPVQHDSLFPVFSVTKGVTAGMVHWFVDKGKLRFDENVTDIWPGFGTNKKDSIKVHHVLNHTSGLHNAMSEAFSSISFVSNWEACLNGIVTSIPESEPGQEQLYHYASFGWLCGGIIEHVSGMKFQEVLDQAIVQPLNVQGEFYIGIPPGVESRLATLTPDFEDMKSLNEQTDTERPDLPSSFQPSLILQNLPIFANLFSLLEVRRAIAPAANGHFTARALARYYATLANGGIVPKHNTKIFNNPKIHEAFMGVGEYEQFVYPNGGFGLGFRRYVSKEGTTGFGHSGIGGSVGFCDVENKFAIAVFVNKMSLGLVTAFVVELICRELNVPVPVEYEKIVEEKSHMKLT